jgi:hypothetical protein
MLNLINKNSIFFVSLFILLILPYQILNMYAQKYQTNVFGDELKKCKDGTGFYRNGYCNTGEDDHGTHVVCAVVTDEFLKYTKSKGNDLSTPNSYFPGLKAGDHWCLCGYRFEQARRDGFAPKVYLEATHHKALEFTPLDVLKKFNI